MSISPDEVRAEVRKLWDSYCRKSKTQFAEMYSPSATVFSMDTFRVELARLMLVRRERELFGPASSVAVKLGQIDVQLLGSDVAVASYPYHFSITRVLPGGKIVHSEVPCGRNTEVYQRNEKGVLQIIHEHASSGEPVITQQVPATDSPALARKL